MKNVCQQRGSLGRDSKEIFANGISKLQNQCRNTGVIMLINKQNFVGIQ